MLVPVRSFLCVFVSFEKQGPRLYTLCIGNPKAESLTVVLIIVFAEGISSDSSLEPVCFPGSDFTANPKPYALNPKPQNICLESPWMTDVLDNCWI